MMLNYKFSGFKILVSETDKYHMHFMISYGPEISIAKKKNKTKNPILGVSRTG